jgi:hypothetical protein
MARPLIYNAQYFAHDANMRNDRKIKALRKKFSHIGYSVYNCLLEALADSDFFELDLSGQEADLWAADFDCSTSDLMEIIHFCVQIGLLQKKGNNVIYSSYLNEKLAPLLNKRKVDRERIIAARTHSETSFRGDNYKNEMVIAAKTIENVGFRRENTQRKGKESKVKESKDNNSLRSSLSFPPSATTPAHAREGFGDEKDGIDYDIPMTANEGVEILKNDNEWLLQIQRKFAIEQPTISRWLDSFCVDCDCRGKQQHENLADVKQHFNDWLPKMLSSKGNKKTCKEKAANMTPEKIWLRCQAELSQSTNDEIAKQVFSCLKFENFDVKSSVLLLDIPNRKSRDYIEDKFINTITKVLQKHYGGNIILQYRILSN